MIRRHLVAGMLALAALGCRQKESAQTRTAAVINDQTNGGGKPGFYWIPPIVTAAATFTTLDQTGGANNLTVVVDQLLTDNSTTAKTSFTGAAITMVTGASSASFPGVTGPFYGVNWAAGSGVVSGEIYRVSVRALTPARVLGIADVQVVANATQAGMVDRTKFTPLIVGNSLAIVFRLEAKDTDGDTLNDWRDNCAVTKNIGQLDSDADGRGDSCQCLNVPNGIACSTGCKTGMTCQSGACTGGTNVSNGTACGTGNLCKQSEICTNGVCGGGTNKTGSCATGNPCKQSETCTNGVCGGGTNKTGSCATGNPCKQTETCTSGVCGGGTNKTGSCATGNPCKQTETCTSGVCGGGTNKTNGTACGDGNLCTQSDTCQTGVCTGASPITCVSDTCHNTGVCDKTLGICPARKTNGTTCSDGNACTQTDTCQAGVCTGANSVVCTALDTCHVVGVCNTTTGVCTNPNANNGTTCNDNNACTMSSSCQAGVCTGANSVVCTALDACHVAGVCNTTTGVCTNPNANNGTTCNDNNACTMSSSCQGGVCTGANSVVCTALDACHVAGVCNTTTGVCTNPNANNGTTCNDNNACTASSTCQAGVCTGTNSVVCTALDSCHVPGVCNTTTGVCTNPNANNGTSCNDNNACTQSSSCQGGVCTGANPVVCTALDSCHVAGVCSPTTGCSNPNANNGTTCNDNNPCTQSSSCQAGVCTGANPVVCTTDQCHTIGACVSGTGCPAPVAKANGTACDDGNPCTEPDTCQAGSCASSAIVCTPEDSCHEAGVCNVATGDCSVGPAKPEGAPCADASACTSNQTCHLNQCMGGDTVQCAAIDTCHSAGVCDQRTGVCSNPPLPGACQIGVFEYDDAGRLIRDRGATLSYDAYDQLREVRPAPTGPPLLNKVRIDAIEMAGATFISTRGVSARGDVVGTVGMPSGRVHAFLWTRPGPPLDLNQTVGLPNNDAYGLGINDAGIVTGTYLDGAGAWHTFRYDPATGLDDLGATNPQATPGYINIHGQLAGNLHLANGGTLGFRYTDGVGYQEIGTLPGGSDSYAWSVDPMGTVFGSSRVAGTPTSGFNSFGHAVIYSDLIGLQDANQYINPLLGLTLVTANRSSGDWVGGLAWNGGRHLGYRLRLSTGMVDPLGGGWGGNVFGYGINSYGEMVGDGYLDDGNTQKAAWVFTDQVGFRDLNELVDPGLGWYLSSGVAINDAGDVTGYGLHNGVPAAFVVHLPLRASTSGTPSAIVRHTYGHDGLRTSTTTAPGAAGAATQVWFTQDYTERNGKREHYVRVGDRIVARVTSHPTGGSGASAAAVVEPRATPRSPRANTAITLTLLLATLLALAFAMASRRRWTSGVAALLAVLLGAASCDRLESTPSGELLSWSVDSNQTHYFHDGVAFGPNLITDSSGALVEERRYDPFGQPVDPIDVVAEPQNILGKLTDPSTGWSYHGARWMAPQTARWSAPDPATKALDEHALTMPWDLNPYAYARQNPAVHWDPDGAQARGGRGRGNGRGGVQMWEPPKLVDPSVENWRRQEESLRQRRTKPEPEELKYNQGPGKTDLPTLFKPPYQSGQTPLRVFDIDFMGSFNTKARVRDGKIGHELYQYSALRNFLRAAGFGEKQIERGSRMWEIFENPAVALTKDQHEDVNREQRKLGLWNEEFVKTQSPIQIILLNRQALLNAKVAPVEVVETLYKEAMEHARNIGAIPRDPPPPTIGGQ